MNEHCSNPPPFSPRALFLMTAAIAMPCLLALTSVFGAWSTIRENEPRVGVWETTTGIVSRPGCSHNSSVAFRYEYMGQLFETTGTPIEFGFRCQSALGGEGIVVSVNPANPVAMMTGTPEFRIARARHRIVADPIFFLILASIAGIVEVTIYQWRMSRWKQKHLPPGSSGGRC